MRKDIWRYLLYVSITTLWIAVIAIVPDFLDNPITNIQGVVTILTYVIAISIVSFLWLYIIALNKYVAMILVPLYGVIGY